MRTARTAFPSKTLRVQVTIDRVLTLDSLFLQSFLFFFFSAFFEKIPCYPCDDEDGEDVCTWDQLKQGYYSNPAEHDKASDNSNYVKKIAYHRQKQNRDYVFNDVEYYADDEKKQFIFGKNKVSREGLELFIPLLQAALILQQYRRSPENVYKSYILHVCISCCLNNRGKEMIRCGRGV